MLLLCQSFGWLLPDGRNICTTLLVVYTFASLSCIFWGLWDRIKLHAALTVATRPTAQKLIVLLYWFKTQQNTLLCLCISDFSCCCHKIPTKANQGKKEGCSLAYSFRGRDSLWQESYGGRDLPSGSRQCCSQLGWAFFSQLNISASILTDAPRGTFTW